MNISKTLLTLGVGAIILGAVGLYGFVILTLTAGIAHYSTPLAVGFLLVVFLGLFIFCRLEKVNPQA